MTLTVTDLFAGAGGSSSGMVQIPGVSVKIAANHWDIACEIHNANHPDTDHSTADLHEEDPAYFPRTDILWASPECTKWSQASGSRYAKVSMEATLLDPELMEDEDAAVAQRSRLLMFDVLRFIEHHRYRLVFIENVVDIAMRPKYALAWAHWRRALRRLGYKFRVLSINSMHAQAFGAPAPQSRDRIYVAAWPENEAAPDFDRILRPQAYCPRCDAVVESQQAWKNQRTVGKYRDQYVYVHGACGTVVEPGYLPAAAAIDWTLAGDIIGDRLAEKTRLRIAAGIARFWGPFHYEHAGNQYDAADPKHAQHGDPDAYYRTWGFDDVIRTLHTVESKALAIPEPFVSELYGTSTGRPVTDPAGTFTASGNHHALVTRHYGIPGGDAARHTTPAGEELRTLTANGGNMSLLSPYYSGSEHARPIDEPIGTLTTVDRYALVHRNNGGGAEMTTSIQDYLRTLTTAGHQSLIQAPARVRRKVTAADLATAMEMVAECRFRMFQPHEVAAGMAFASDYNWQPPREKPVTKRDLVKAAGNAVCPPNARDLMAAGVESIRGAA